MRGWLLALSLVSVAAAAADDGRERAAYDRYRKPDALIAALGLKPGQAVADVGAGRGYLTLRLAAAVGPSGRVTATDIDDAALAVLAAQPHEPHAAPIATLKVAPDAPSLEPRAYDLILLAEVDHLLSDRAAYLTRLLPSLRPGGRIAVSNRKLYRAQLLTAAARAGLAPVGETALDSHFLVLLQVGR